MRKMSLVLTPVTTMVLVGVVGAASAYAGAVFAAAKVTPTISVVCVPGGTARVLTAPVRGVCPRGTVLHRFPGGPRGLTGAQGPAGPAGAAGVAGPQGVPGKNGTNGKNGATNVTVMQATKAVAPNTDHSFGIACPAGSVATGGGFTGQRAATVKVVTSKPSFGGDAKPTGWETRVHNSGATTIHATGYVVCAAP